MKTGQISGSFTDLIKSKFSVKIRKLIETSGTQVILVPSLLDIHHPDFVFPQAAFDPAELDLPDSVLMYPNPVLFYVNEVALGFTNNDVLFHLSNEETSRGVTGNKINRLASYVIDQRCFYPLFPPRTGANLELPMLPKLDLPVTPDVMFFPSTVAPFAKDVDGVLCVNPGKLTKAQQGGTYSKITILPFKKTGLGSLFVLHFSSSSHTLLLLTEIPEGKTPMLNRVSERAQVEVIRL